ncbi:aldehyde dehydrogenase family protein [Bacillus amyloliquefaciens]|uniref:aldehyde dehydrogenase family protein n=1 Tax=Bacillus amyloliquefaciens TaxID=1390 RepID=UPI00374E1264
MRPHGPKPCAPIAVVNPVTEEVFATIPRGTPGDAGLAAFAAAHAFDGWSQTSVEDRASLFKRVARLTEARADEITRTIVRYSSILHDII